MAGTKVMVTASITHTGVSPVESPVTSCSTPRATTAQATARETPRYRCSDRRDT